MEKIINVTDVNLFISNDGKYNTKAIAMVTLNDCLKLTGIKFCIDEKGKCFLRYPINTGNKHAISYFYPLNRSMSDEILEAIKERYFEILDDENDNNN